MLSNVVSFVLTDTKPWISKNVEKINIKKKKGN